MKRQGWIGFLIGIVFCLLMALPPAVQASLDIDSGWSGVLLLNAENNGSGSYSFEDGTLNRDAYIRAGGYGDGLAVNSNGWRIFNDGGYVYNSSASGLIFGYPFTPPGLMAGSLYNNSGAIIGDTDGVKMGAGSVTNDGSIYGYGGYGIYQYSTGASDFTVSNGVYIPLTVVHDPETGAMTITMGTPDENSGLGSIYGYYGGIYSYIGGAGTATVYNSGTIIGGYGGGVNLYGNGTSTATVTNLATITGGYYGGYYDGIAINSVDTATVNNLGGTITGSDDGVDIENTKTKVTVNNVKGNIYGYGGHGVSLDNTDSVSVGTTLTVNNSGGNIWGMSSNSDGVSIFGNGTDTAVVLNGATDDGAGNVTITGTGQIMGRELGVGISGMGTATVTNYSPGFGGYGGISGYMLGVGIEDTGTATVNNYGAGLINGMLGGVGMSNVNTATVNNSGTIEGLILGVGVRNYDEDLDEYIKTAKVTIDNSGTIQGDWFGVTIMGADTATVMNSSVNSISATGSGFGEGFCSGSSCYAFGDGVYIKEVNTAEVLNGATIDEEDIVTITGGTIEGIANSYYDYDDNSSFGGYAYAYGKGVKIEDSTTATVTNYGDATNIGLISGTANAYGEGADEIGGPDDDDDYNDGNAYAYAYGVNIEHAATSAVNNIGGTISGTSEARGYSGYSEAYGVYIDSIWNSATDTAMINNSGDIIASASGYGYYDHGEANAYGIYIDDADTVTVNNYVATVDGETTTITGGTISGTALGQSDGSSIFTAEAKGYGLDIKDAATKVTVTSYGDITGSGTALADMPYGSETVPDYDEYDNAYGDGYGIKIKHSPDVTVTNVGGTISGTGEARGYGGYSDAYGVNIDAIWDSATDKAEINNSGTIRASASGYGYGYYGRGDGDAYGVYIDDADTVTVNNYVATVDGETTTITGGTISAMALGQSDGGTAAAKAYGLDIKDAATKVTVTSYGDITGSATALADMPYGSETVPDYDDFGNAYAKAYGVNIKHSQDVTVTEIDGTISGTSEARGNDGHAEAYGVNIDAIWDSSTDKATINNSGTISASASGYSYGNMKSAYAYGIMIDDADTVTVNNYVATVDGDITTITGGTISGTALGQSDGYTAEAEGYGLDIKDAVTKVTVTSYGDITGSATALADMPYGSETVPDYDDKGTAIGDAYGINIKHSPDVTVTNVGGTISGTGEARGSSGYSDAYGVKIDAIWDENGDTATINNSGTISGMASGYGYYVHGDADAYGVKIDDADTVTVNNYVATVDGETTTITGGTIEGIAHAESDGSSNLTAEAKGYGLDIKDAATKVTVTSYGDITGSGTALADMPYGNETVPDYDEYDNAYGDAYGINIKHSQDVTVTEIDGTISATGEARGYGGYSDAYGVKIDAIWDDIDTATINNSGTISALASGYGYGYYGDADAYGVKIDDADTVTVNNYVATLDGDITTITGGTIEGIAHAESDGYTAEAGGLGLLIEDATTKVTVTSYGDITGTATALGDMPYGIETVPDYDTSGYAYAYADGVVIEHTAEATVNNVGGTISGTATGTGFYGQGYGGGVWIDSLYDESGDTATVNNSGTISGTGTGNSYYDNAYGYGGGVYIDDAETATVLNGATIVGNTVTITGGTISGTGTGNNYYGSGYGGYGYGVGVYIEDAETATVTNYGDATNIGLISGTGTGYGYGGGYGVGYGYGVFMEDILGARTATVTNIGGTISGTGTGLSGVSGSGNGYGYGVYMSYVDAAVVTNGAIDGETITGGTISGTGVAYNDGYASGFGVYIQNAGTVNVNNYGTITGTSTVCPTCTISSYGIYIDEVGAEAEESSIKAKELTESNAVTIYNYGIISGGVGIWSDGNTDIENHGTIMSTNAVPDPEVEGSYQNFKAIYLDDGNNYVKLGTGSVIIGNIVVDNDDQFENNYIELNGEGSIYASQINGFDGLSRTGTGTWTLKGDKDYTDDYMGNGPMPITVTGGVLAFGARETTAGVITDYLTVAEGASIGYVITPEGSTGAVTVTEDADFNDSTVVVIPTPTNANEYLLTTTYEDVLTVAGTIYNKWTDVTTNLAFLTAELIEDAGYAGTGEAYDLILNRLSFTTGADESTTPLGQFLDELYGSTDDEDTLAWLNFILTQVAAGDAQQALAELSGGSHTAFQLMSFNGLDKYLGILNNHMGGMGGFAGNHSSMGFALNENGTQLAMAGSGDTISDVAPMMFAAVGNMIGQGQAAKGTNWGLWADGYLGTGNRRSNELITKYKQNLFGGIIGFDYRVAGDLYLGISGGISRTKVDFDDLLDNGHMDSYHGSLYLNYNGKPWYAAGVATYAYNKYNLDRYITTLGPTQIASSDYSGNEYAGYVEVGYKFDLGNVEIRPLAAFQIDYLEQEDFTETGSDYNLYVEKQETGSYKSFLGMNVTGTIKLSETAAFKPELRLKWAHEFSNDDHMINASFDGMGSGSFIVAAEKLSRDSAIIGVGMSLLFNKHVSAYIQYDAELNSDYVNHTGLAGLRLAW